MHLINPNKIISKLKRLFIPISKLNNYVYHDDKICGDTTFNAALIRDLTVTALHDIWSTGTI